MLTNPMFTKIMQYVCAGVLLLTAFWVATPGTKIVLDIVVCVGALMVATQAVARRKRVWAGGFIAIAVLFNPILPVVISRNVFLVLDVACVLAFITSIAVLKNQPILSIPSITNRTPGSQSL